MIVTPFRVALALLLALLVTGELRAQTPAPPAPKAREGKAEFALVSATGNADAQTVAAAGEITLRPPRWVILGKVGFVRQEAEDVVSAKSTTSLERAGRILTTRLQAFGQHAYLRDLFAGVENRNSIDGGLSYLLVQAGKHTLFADGGLGYLKEQRTTGPSLSTPIGTAGTRYRLRFTETNDLTDDLQTSFDFDKDGTWRLNHTIALTARVVSMLSLKLSNQLRFVGEPVPGFEQTDSVTSAALVLGF